MNQQIGRGSLCFSEAPFIIGTASVVGTKEGEGPIASEFDCIGEDDKFGQDTWEEAESCLQQEALTLALGKADKTPEEMRYLFAGDLLGQLIASSFGLKSFEIPLFGLYGACSTCGEALALSAMTVAAGYADHVAAVTLVKGKVAVTLDQKKTISLSPGEKIDYNLATSLYNVNKTNTYKWCSWKDGILIFRDDPLEYVFKRLGQTYNVEFILKDAELGKYSYKATFEGESLNEILRLLEMSAPIRCKEVSNRNSNNEKFEKQRIEVSRTMQ